MKCTLRILCLLSIITIIASPLNAFETTSPQSSQTTSYNLLLTVQTDQPFYGFGENVKILGNLTDMNGTAVRDALIALEVRNPRNTTIFVDIVFSSTDGTYEDGFRLSNNAALGEYHVYVTANAAGYATAANQTTFTVVTKADLSEKSFIESALVETLREQRALLNNAAVSGDLTGTVNFTYFEIVDIATGSFAGKGFSRGDWKAVLDGILYSGSHEGVLFLKPSERRIYLKGAISGEISGIVEGFISETVNGSGIYNRYQATWKIGRIRTTTVSATLNLNGTLTYNSYSEYPATALYILQTSIEGSAFGHYNCSISSTITHVRFMNSSHTGEGFSIISYSSNYGMGEGWTYCRLASPGIVEMEGFLTSPLYGIVHATLNETSLPRNLQMYIERVDLGLPPKAELKVAIWGPESVSPGQTISYAIEFRNDGLKSAENATIAIVLPSQVTYKSNTGVGFYDSRFNEVAWRFATLPAKAWGYETVTVGVATGLAQNTIIQPILAVPTKEITVLIDPAVGVTEEVVEATVSSIEMKNRVVKESTSGDLDVMSFVAPIVDAIEPSFSMVTIGDEITIEYEFSMGDTLEAQELFGVGNHQKIWGSVKGAKWAWDTYSMWKDAQDSIKAGKAREDFLQWALEANHIQPETYEFLSGWSIDKALCEFIIPNAIKHIPILGPAYYSITTNIMKAIDRAFFLPALLNRMMIDYPDSAPNNLEEMIEEYLNARSSAVSSTRSRVVTARDPNVKYGPEGYVSAGQPLNYTVEFENEGEGTAYGVYFTDTLDWNLNDSSLQIGPVISKANGSIIADPGTYNPVTRTITWLVGEVGPGEGGNATFSVKVKDGAPEGTEVTNFATVYFPSVPETTRTNTIVSVVGQPSIAVKDLTPLETSAERGSILCLNATVANEGHFAEAVNVTLYANSTIVGTRNITLTGRSENTVIFIWNTTNSLTGNYTISAYAEPVPGETNTTDNLYVDGIVQIVPSIHDIAITNITFSEQYPAINETIQIFVTIENRGTLTEAFDVSVNYTLLLDPLIGTQTVTLVPGQSVTLNFTWAPNATGRYEIKAYTSEIPDDINPSDNTKITYLYVSATYTAAFSTEENDWANVGVRGGRFYFRASPV